MNRRNLSRVLTLTFLLLLASVAAQGQIARAFVSSTGSDANDCSRPSPCRNFQRGHDAVVSGGEVVALDSAGYGSLTITKSVKLTGEGVHAALTSPPAGGIVVLIDGPSITVTLRNIHVQSHPTSTSGIGIVARNFSVVHIENCTVRAAGDGFLFLPVPTDGTPNRKLFIKDSLFRNNAGSGIYLQNFADTGTLSATIERTRMENNHVDGAGFERTKVTLRDCLSSGNNFSGIRGRQGSEINLESCITSNNAEHGIIAADTTGVIVRVSNSTATNNGQFGFYNATGNTFESRQNNTVRGNTLGNTAGVITPISGT